MKKYIIWFISAMVVLWAAFAGVQVYNDLVVSGDVYFENLPMDWEYPTVSIDSGGRMYQNEVINVSAHTIGATTMVTTGADTYYAIPGPFENDVVNWFIWSWDSIVYVGWDSRILFFYTTSVSSDTNNTVASANILFNGVPLPASLSVSKIESTSSSASMSAVATRVMTSWDVVQLVLKSDKAGATITFESYSTIAQRF